MKIITPKGELNCEPGFELKPDKELENKITALVNDYVEDRCRNTVFCGQDEPSNPKDGDIWVPLSQPAYKRGVFLR